MRQIIAGRFPFVYRQVSADEARQIFAGQPYKLELIDGLDKGGLDEYGQPLADKPVISFYTQDTFTDLCRGPHVEHTGQINPGCLQADERGRRLLARRRASKPMLQRIYGTAWPNKKELQAYLWMLEEAKKRDHRKLGKDLGLFYFSDDVGPGLPLFSPKGEMLRYLMESYVREAQTRYGYQHVWTGHLVKEDLYKRSGHYDNYKDAMFPPMVDENVAFRLKPMNCPSHMTLYKEMGIHSYRELPLRFAEFATLYRYEKTRRAAWPDARARADAGRLPHLLPARPDRGRVQLCLKLIREVLARYEFTDYRVRLSLKGDAGKYVADDEKWARPKARCARRWTPTAWSTSRPTAKAAFYGPKADFMAKDVLGREWQLSTIQVDFIQPARLGLRVHRRGRPAAHAGGAAPRRHGRHGALPRRDDRALRRRLPGLAGARAGGADPDRRPAHGLCARSGAKLKAQGVRVLVDERGERMNAKIRDAQARRCRTCWWWATRNWNRVPPLPPGENPPPAAFQQQDITGV